jgi:hypothetical protein
MPDEIKIVPANGHYEVYINGTFYCSAETLIEAIKEIESHDNLI